MSNSGIVALGFTLIFLFTCAGAATVYLFKGEISSKLNTLFLGFAAGVMIAATIWSLLLPSIEGAAEIFDNKYLSILPAAVGFIVGGLFLVFLDKVIPHFHFGTDKEEGHRSNFQKTTKLFLAVTIHNIPEGIAAGVAFGAAASLGEHSAYLSALGLAIGLGLQNFPEGASVALPMKNHSGADIRGARFLSRGIRQRTSAVASRVCGRRDDIRRCRRPDTRRKARGASAPGHMGRHDRFCRDDDTRCSAGLTEDLNKRQGSPLQGLLFLSLQKTYRLLTL